MSPVAARNVAKTISKKSTTKYINYIKKILLDPHELGPVCFFLFLAEAICNIIIIEKVRYTEIDWTAYMQQVEGFLNGTLDYQYLKGDTGPLVYPAGHLYIFTGLYFATNRGRNIYLAQYIFLMFYLIQTLLVHRIYRITAKIPPYALIIFAITSYRIHSIYVLRLFNDPIAVLLFYISLSFFVSNKWYVGSLFYSLAVGVKMNILLYAPCLLVAYLTNLNYQKVLLNLFICGIVQLLLGLPFLYTNAISYLKCSFDLGRVFEHQWTVNYRFLTIELFEHKYFHIGLLILHVFLLIVFLPMLRAFFSSYAKLNYITKSFMKLGGGNNKDEEYSKYEEKLNRSNERFSKTSAGINRLFILPFFVTNLIGITCARSLHYQFYAWYYHSLLYLVFSTKYTKPTKFFILGLIEYSFNVYPSTNISSVLIHLCHIALIFGVYKTMNV